MKKWTIIPLLSLSVLLVVCCSQKSAQLTQLRHFPIDEATESLAGESAKLDLAVSFDGNGSLRIDAEEAQVVPLFEVSGLAIEDALLIYQARVRTEDIRGQVYLEMWCFFPGRGEFFSRGLRSALAGSSGWQMTSTPFLLRRGQTPERVKLNLVIDGAGTAWIDDVRLLHSQLS